MATAAHTGELHPTGATAAPTGQEGGLHTAGAPAQKRGGMFGGRNKEVAVGVDSGRNRGGGFALNNGARMGLALSQLLTIIAFLIVLGGLSSLQKHANSTQLLGAGQAGLYAEAFQSGGLRPYPGQGKNQFGLQWWILMFEIFIFLMICVLLVMPRHLLRLKHTAMAFLVYVFVFTTLSIDSLLWFKRGSVVATTALGATSIPAVDFFGKRRIEATLAGTIIGAVANALSIIFLGLLRDTRHHHDSFTGSKRVGHEGVGQPGVASAV